MNVAYLLTGGNIGNRLQTLELARQAIEKTCGQIAQASPVYETAAWGLTEQNPFLNQALELHTQLQAHELLQGMLRIEQALGRIRDVKYGPRIIDIDMLLFNNAIINTANLIVPHPQLPNRRFALQCLANIAGEQIHPILKKSINQLLLECPDPLEVHKFKPE